MAKRSNAVGTLTRFERVLSKPRSALAKSTTSYGERPVISSERDS